MCLCLTDPRVGVNVKRSWQKVFSLNGSFSPCPCHVPRHRHRGPFCEALLFLYLFFPGDLTLQTLRPPRADASTGARDGRVKVASPDASLGERYSHPLTGFTPFKPIQPEIQRVLPHGALGEGLSARAQLPPPSDPSPPRRRFQYIVFFPNKEMEKNFFRERGGRVKAQVRRLACLCGHLNILANKGRVGGAAWLEDACNYL